MCYISVRPGRHSYAILERTREFVINITTKDLAFSTDWCGVKSGRQHKKFEEMKLTPGLASKVKAPTIEEAPINIECKVTQIIKLGTHDMFMAEVVNVKADEAFIDEKTGAFDLEKAQPIAYSHGQYFTLGKRLGKFGFSVEKKKRKKLIKR
jgi:flavin reductase (DIM6/NTAB) family NADH-FMN oxidoreductase RutF